MFNVRWYKVFNDLLGNKTRTALIVLSITVGLFAIGMIARARIILIKEMNKSYAAIHPSSGVIRTIQTYDEDFVRSVRRVKGTADADARTHLMTFLLAIVGGLGLMGTLSINVLERTREIGVMRAIGAPDGAVAQVFIVEGIVIGVISWPLGVILSILLGNLLIAAIGKAVLETLLASTFSAAGAWVWLVVVIALSALASFLPARNATRLTVRDVLAYE